MKKLLAFSVFSILLVGCNYNSQPIRYVDGDGWEDSLYWYKVIIQKRPKNEAAAERYKRLFGDTAEEKVMCIEDMVFVKTPDGNITQIKNQNGSYKKCAAGSTPSFGYGSKLTPVPYRKGLPVNLNWWYIVGGINMKAIHGDPLGILEVNELFAKIDLNKRRPDL